jgi:outer membrane receptor protein involved in Fe transport
VAGARGDYKDYAYFAEVPGGLFAPIYGEATITKIMGDFYLELGPRDMIAAQATFVESMLDSSNAQVPYVPKWTAEFMYARRLVDLPITLTATARYIGERSAPAGDMLEDAILLGLKGRYAINSHFDAMLELSNLANQRYELWPGYRERGFFGAIGLGVKY